MWYPQMIRSSPKCTFPAERCILLPKDRISIAVVGDAFEGVPILMDRAYEGDDNLALALAYGHEPIVPPKKNLKPLWEYDKEKYKRRNIVERLFRDLRSSVRFALATTKPMSCSWRSSSLPLSQSGFSSVNTP